MSCCMHRVFYRNPSIHRNKTIRSLLIIIIIIIIIYFIHIIIIIIMFTKGQACFLFLKPQDEVGPSISSSDVLCSFILLVDTVVLVLVFYLCSFSVHVVATLTGIVLFPLLCYVLPFFP